MACPVPRPQPAPPSPLPELARRARVEEEEGRLAIGSGLDHFLTAGKALWLAKTACLDRGTPWLEWLEEEWPYGERCAQRRIRLYNKEREGSLSVSAETDTGLAEALDLIADHRDDDEDSDDDLALLDAELSALAEQEGADLEERAKARRAIEYKTDRARWLAKLLTSLKAALRRCKALEDGEVLALVEKALQVLAARG